MTYKNPQSPTAKATRKRYSQSPVGKLIHKSYQQSPAGKAAQERWRKSPPGKVSARGVKYKKKYGLSIAEYEQILADQGGVCAACRTDTPGRAKEHFCVDHNHAKKKGELGFIRGLLCNECNIALSYMDDDLDRIIDLAVYLERAMGPLKKNLTPIGKGGITKHAGKGAAPFPPQPKPGPLTMGAPSPNNYAKATPLPMPPPPPMGGSPQASAMGAPPAPGGGMPPPNPMGGP